jgi:hypothetical protein
MGSNFVDLDGDDYSTQNWPRHLETEVVKCVFSKFLRIFATITCHFGKSAEINFRLRMGRVVITVSTLCKSYRLGSYQLVTFRQYKHDQTSITTDQCRVTPFEALKFVLSDGG